MKINFWNVLAGLACTYVIGLCAFMWYVQIAFNAGPWGK